MSKRVGELMTRDPIVLDAGAKPSDAANAMKVRDVGDVLVSRDGRLFGIVTDRDLVVRCLAENGDPSPTRLDALCSTDLATLEPGDSVEEAVRLMERHAVRRLPIVENGVPVGILSLGDLARARDPRSALARISGADPNN
jgi:CBS domain-containing protein